MKCNSRLLGIGLFILTLSQGRAQIAKGSIERLDPAFDSLVPNDATIEKLAGGFDFVEAPLWRSDGQIWFSDVVGNVLRSVTPN